MPGDFEEPIALAEETPMIVEEVAGVVSGIFVLMAGNPAFSGRPQTAADRIGQRKEVDESTDEDGKKLVKVRDAIRCAEAFMNSSVVSQLILTTIKGLLHGDLEATNAYFDEAMHRLAECIRAKALQQNNPKHARFGRRKRVVTRRPGV